MFISSKLKENPKRRWELPDEIFFSCGACHILAHTFLEAYNSKEREFNAIWIRPQDGHSGNHIYVTDGEIVFDYQGFQAVEDFKSKYEQRMKSIFYQWDCDYLNLPQDVLISEKKSREYEGLWLREPQDFFRNPILRAQNYIKKFQSDLPVKSKT